MSQLFTYQKYILRNIHVSRQLIKNVHECPLIESFSLQINPISKDNARLLSATALGYSLIGLTPSQLFKTSRRSKERFLSGSKTTLRKQRALNLLSVLKTLVLFNSVNFKGFNQTKPNRSASLVPKHFSFFIGTSRAFETELMGFGDEGLAAHAVITLSHIEKSGTTLRSFRLPVYS